MSTEVNLVIEHTRAPRNKGLLENPQACGKAAYRGRAPQISLSIRVERDVVREIGFQTAGCGYAIACCSILTIAVKGKAIERCLALTGEDINDALGGLPPHKRHCADVAVAALQDALKQLRFRSSP